MQQNSLPFGLAAWGPVVKMYTVLRKSGSEFIEPNNDDDDHHHHHHHHHNNNNNNKFSDFFPPPAELLVVPPALAEQLRRTAAFCFD